MLQVLRQLRGLPGHVFWPDDISLADPARIDAPHVHGAAQLTGIYLLALAVRHGGRRATFDTRLPTRAVQGGAKALTLLAPTPN